MWTFLLINLRIGNKLKQSERERARESECVRGSEWVKMSIQLFGFKLYRAHTHTPLNKYTTGFDILQICFSKSNIFKSRIMKLKSKAINWKIMWCFWNHFELHSIAVCDIHPFPIKMQTKISHKFTVTRHQSHRNIIRYVNKLYLENT